MEDAQRAHVLIVEDDDFTRFVMKEVLESLRLRFTFAADGEECLSFFNKGPGDFGLILMDLHLPKMSGIDAVSAIRSAEESDARKVPIIAITSDVTYHNEDVVRKLGMDGFMSKPVSPGQLLDLVKKHSLLP